MTVKEVAEKLGVDKDIRIKELEVKLDILDKVLTFLVNEVSALEKTVFGESQI